MNSKVHITVVNDGNKSVMKDCYAETPYKITVLPNTRNKEVLNLMLMSSSPGLLEGDVLNMDVVLEKGSRCAIEGQAFQRAFTSKSIIYQTQSYQLDEGSCLQMLMQPLVLHKESHLYNKVSFKLSDRSTLLYADIITPGRQAFGELFSFSSFKNELSLYHNDKLLLKDLQTLIPDEQPLGSITMYEGFTHQGTFIFAQMGDNQVSFEEVEQLLEISASSQKLIYGHSSFAPNCWGIKTLSNTTEDLQKLHQKIAKILYTQ